MAYVIAAPEMLSTTAVDVADVGSAISEANAAATGSTTGVAVAAADEVSAAVATLFSAYGRDYQAIMKHAAAFHDQFARALHAAEAAYTNAEATNAAAISDALSELNELTQARVGHPLIAGGTAGSTGALTSAVTALSANPITALIMGGTGNPGPDPGYRGDVNDLYIQRLFPGANPVALSTPEQFFPINSFGNLTFAKSVTQGLASLDAAINAQINGGNNVVVFGYSQSATIATNEMRILDALPVGQRPDPSQLAFILIADPNNPVGGILERFPGFYVPLLDIPLNGATPANTPYPTSIYTVQYDGIADFPQYPLNVLSDINAVMGVVYLHHTYPLLTPDQVAGAVQLATSPGYTGDTHYYMILTQDLPLVQPIRDIPNVGPAIADLIQPDLRVLVDMGYGNLGPGFDYANIPTPARLLHLVDPVTVGFDLANGAVQGSQAALVDLGVLPQSFLPDTYPFVPSVQPGLDLSFGQPSVTGLSLVTGALGPVLELIPPLS
jgi:hypothetical protein